MILDQKQCRRFYKLFDHVIAYAAQRLGIFGTLADSRGHTNEREVYRVAEQIWGEDGNRNLIRDFVDENPWKFNRTDLREVESWHDALCERFPIVRIGRDVLFLYGGHAFAVRGLSKEIDEVTGPLPVFAHTIIMPFDGLITYCTAITSYQLEVGPSMRLSLTEEAAEYCATGKLVRSAKDYARAIPEAKKEELERQAKEFAHKTELEMNAHELGEGQHEGVLAGLSWDEREKAVRSHVKSTAPIANELLQRHFDEWCEPGRPAKTLAEAFAPLTKKDLVEFAKAYGVRGGLSKLNKAQLIDEIVYTIKDDGPLFVECARMYGVKTLKGLSKACMRGGRVEYAEKDLLRFDDIPIPSFPAMLLYHDRKQGVYTMRVPQEVLEALDECPWDSQIALAEEIETIVHRLELLVDYRGVVRFEDAVLELFDDDLGNNADADPFSMLSTIQKRSMWQTADFDIVEIGEDIFFLHPYVSEDAGLQGGGKLSDPDHVLSIFGVQQSKPPRRYEDIEGGLGVYEWMLTRKSVRDLMAYLDAHVPDGRDDYFFAENLVGDIIEASRDFCDMGFLMDRFEQDGFVPTEAQLNHLLGLIIAVVNDTPKWDNNGWSPAELGEDIRER